MGPWTLRIRLAYMQNYFRVYLYKTCRMDLRPKPSGSKLRFLPIRQLFGLQGQDVLQGLRSMDLGVYLNPRSM